MEPSSAWLRDRLRAARVARLATVSADGRPHLVPVTFALDGDVAVTAVDHKPKTTTRLRRLRNITETGRVSLLADEYHDQDWSRLWWVRADGTARVVTEESQRAGPVALLCDKYPQYRAEPPAGPVIRIEIDTLRGWRYTG